MRKSVFRSALFAAVLLAGSAFSGAAPACDEYAVASADGGSEAGIVFRNESTYAMSVLWSDFDGTLVEYALLQPFEETGYDTYLSHLWFVEVHTPEGPACLGPIEAAGSGTCDVTILGDADGLGVDDFGCLM